MGVFTRIAIPMDTNINCVPLLTDFIRMKQTTCMGYSRKTI